MPIKYQGHENRRKKAQNIWSKIVASYNNGVPVEDIRNKIKNPKTGRKYSRQWIYKILEKYNKEELN